MSSFVAKNQIPDSELTEDDLLERTTELQIQECFKLYRQALDHQRSGHLLEAAKVYKTLDAMDILRVEIPTDDEREGLLVSLCHLRFLVDKNYALLSLQSLSTLDNRNGDNGLFETKLDAVARYCNAVAFDSSDVDGLAQCAMLSLELGHVRRARFCFETLFYETGDTTIVQELLEDSLSLKEQQALLRKLSFRGRKIFPQYEKLVKSIWEIADINYLDGEMIQDQKLPNASTTQSVNRSRPLIKCKKTCEDVGQALVDLVEEGQTFAEIEIYNYKKDGHGQSPDDTRKIIDLEADQPNGFADSKATEVVVIDREETPSEISSIKRRGSDVEQSSVRASKRVRVLRNDLAPDATRKESDFADTLNEIFANVPLAFGDPQQLSYVSNIPISERIKVTEQMRASLANWSGEYTLLILKPVESQRISARDIHDMLVRGHAQHEKSSTHVKGVWVDEMEELIASTDQPVIFLLWRFVAILLKPNAERHYYRSIKFPHLLKEVLASAVDKVELVILKVVEQMTAVDQVSDALEFLSAIVDIYVDALFQEDAENITQQDTLAYDRYLRLHRFRSVLREIYLKHYAELDPSLQIVFHLRILWTSAQIAHLEGSRHEEIRKLFEDSISFMNSADVTNLRLENYNNDTIPEISVEAGNTELSKLKTIEYFSEMFESDSSDNHRVNEQLESLLLRSDSNLDEHLSEIKHFIENASSPFQFAVLKQLEDFYRKQDRFDDACLLVLTRSLPLSLESLEEKTDVRNRVEYLRTFALIGDQMEKVIEYMSPRNDRVFERLTLDQINGILDTLIRLFQPCIVFVSYEDAVEEKRIHEISLSTFQKVADKWKRLIIHFTLVIYFLVKVKLKLSGYSDFHGRLLYQLARLHEEYGLRGYCWRAKYMFLNTILTENLAAGRGSIKNETIQCLYCLYDIMLPNDEGLPIEHEAQSKKVDKDASMKIATFLADLVPRKSDGEIQAPKSELKQALDKVCEMLESSLKSVDAADISVNRNALDRYLSSYISESDISNALLGRFSIHSIPIRAKLAFPQDLYHIQGEIHMIQHRNKLKTLGSRLNAEDASTTINFFKNDLVINPNRFQSWNCLGQLYSWAAEDSLSWSADHIEKNYKEIGANQRRSILCKIAALSIMTKKDMDTFSSSYRADFFVKLGHQIYSYARPPMNMRAFSNKKITIGSSSEGLYARQPGGLSENQVLCFALSCLEAAGRLGNDEWQRFFAMGKISRKMRRPAGDVMRYFVQALHKAPEKGSFGGQEPLLEPHYKIFSLASKYVESGELDIGTALEFIRLSRYYRGSYQPVLDKTRFLTEVLRSLSYLAETDKKHWQHRPIYRIARISQSLLGDLQTIRTQFESFVAKGGKVLASIWKPELETPGRHFVFIRQYISYDINMLIELRDSEGMKKLLPKVRKGANLLLGHQQIWEVLCRAYLRLLREQYGITANFEAAYSISSDVFKTIASSVQGFIKSHDKTGQLLKALREANDLRRMNAGLISASWMDDFMVDCYLILFDIVKGRLNPTVHPISTGNEDPKVVRKDVLVEAQKLATAVSAKQPRTPLSKDSGKEAIKPPNTHAQFSGYGFAGMADSPNLSAAQSQTSSPIRTPIPVPLEPLFAHYMDYRGTPSTSTLLPDTNGNSNRARVKSEADSGRHRVSIDLTETETETDTTHVRAHTDPQGIGYTNKVTSIISLCNPE